MKLQRILKIFRKRTYQKETSSFSDFFRHASAHEKEKILTEAAQRANEEQRENFARSLKVSAR